MKNKLSPYPWNIIFPVKEFLKPSNQIVFAWVITLPLLTLWNSWIALTRKNSIWKSYMLEISIIQGLIKLGDQG